MAELEEFAEEDLMLSDDLMPNSGEVVGAAYYNPLPQADPDQQLVERAEKAMILGATPLLDEIFAWLDYAIEDCDSIRNLKTDSNVSLESQLVGMKHAKSKLVGARSRLQTLKDTYIKDNS